MATNETDKGLFEFLATVPGSSPYQSRAIKIVRRRMGYTVLYMKPTSRLRKVMVWTYSTPKLGGAFKIPHSALSEFPFLVEFAEKKINAVRIIDLLNHTFYKSHRISVMAIEQELSNIFFSMKAAQKEGGGKHEIIAMYNDFCFGSMVCYNVGNHKDNFTCFKPSVENKAVFQVPQLSINVNDKCTWEYSRGGGDRVGEFYYALLDWGDIPVDRRAACIHYGIITPNERVNIRDIRDYFINNPQNANIAPLVGYNIAQDAYEVNL